MTKAPITSKWEYDMEGNLTCMHFMDPIDDNAKDDKDMMVRHCLLEVLATLEVIRYDRGYDGIYYDVTLTRTK